MTARDKLAARRLMDRRRKARRKAVGQCASCSSAAVAPGQMCEFHRGAHRAAQRILKDRRRLRGVCVKCGRTDVSRFKRCHQCRARISEHNRLAYALRRDIVTSLRELVGRMRGLL